MSEYPISFDVPLDEAVAVCKQVLPMMSRQRVPTIPQNYAVWYDYVTGSNDALVQELKTLIDSGQAFSPDRCRDIYQRYYLDAIRAQVDGIQDVMRDKVEAVLKELGMLGQNIAEYSEVHVAAALPAVAEGARIGVPDSVEDIQEPHEGVVDGVYSRIERVSRVGAYAYAHVAV